MTLRVPKVRVPVPRPRSHDNRRRLRTLHQVLILLIWLATLLSILSFVHIEFSSTPFFKEIRKPRTLPTKVQRHQVGYNYQHTFKRIRLTHADYPVTLTTPYIIENPNLCAGMVTLLTIVHTSTDNFGQRARIRKSFGNIHLFKSKYRMKLVFLLGATADTETQDVILKENTLYGDIVQGDFVDSYHNLTLKGVMAFRWISNHCYHAKSVLKIDDDVFVNIFKLVDYYIPLHSGQQLQILCNVMHFSKVQRGQEYKWSVDEDLFRGMEFYPPYCSGFFVLMTTDTVRIMYRAAQFTPFFWVDDVYLFGLLPSARQIKLESLGKNVTFHRDIYTKDYDSDNPTVVACVVEETKDWDYLWNRTLQTLNPAIKQFLSDDVVAESPS